MCVCQYNCSDVARLNWKRGPVQIAQLLGSLKQAAVNEDVVSIEVQQVLGSSDGTCTAERCQREHFAILVVERHNVDAGIGKQSERAVPLLDRQSEKDGQSQSGKNEPA